MKILYKTVKVDKENFNKVHLNIVNSFMEKKLTGTEIEVLAAFMSLDKSIIEEDMFNTLARKQVKEKLGNMSAGGLGNHIKSMILKDVLNKNEITNKITVVSAFIPEEHSQGYQIKLIENVKKEEE